MLAIVISITCEPSEFFSSFDKLLVYLPW